MSTTSQWEMVIPILWSFGWEAWAGIVLTVGVICVSCVWFLYTRNDELLASRKINVEHRLGDDEINDSILKLKHKIFLSHSGKQKEFIEYLCTALESRCRYPFFDKRRSSLSKGEKFANLIFEAVEQCEMMVVVISDEYFMSKWPMMELHAYVQAIEAMKKKGGESRQKYILPLFYKLSVKEFRDKKRQKKWVEKWKSLAKDDGKKGRINVKAWEKAVDELGTYDGISYSQELQEIKAYEKEVVSHICDKFRADVKWDDSHVQGKSNICKVLLEKARSVNRMEKFECKTVGIFGVGGIGKTTICKALCNELSNEYEGRVCHIELEIQTTTSIVVESLRKLVILLTDKNLEFVQKLDEGQCKYILRNSDKRQRTFIALDNVWDASLMQAKMILEAVKFYEESLVIVTARSQNTLEMSGIRGDGCLEMPELGEEDAMKLFMYHAARGKEFESEQEKRDILECIKRCYFDKGGGNGWHYHPLALNSFGAQVSCVGERPSEWVRNLPRSLFVGRGGNPVFDILRSSFDMLEYNEQSLFMDLVIYRLFTDFRGCDFEHGGVGSSWADMVEWLCLVYEVSDDKIKSQLDALKRKGLVQDVDWTSGRISVHDLYMEFAKLESKGMLDESIEFENRRCIISSICDLKKRPSGRCWQKLSRVGILGGMDQIVSLERIKWRFFSWKKEKELEGNHVDVRGSLNLKDLECVRSVAVIDIGGIDRIEGLDGLDDLTFFKWTYMRSEHDYFLFQSKSSIGGQLPTSLVVLEVNCVWLEHDVLVRCNKLHKLTFVNCGAVELDLNNCSSLEIVSLKRVHKLRSLSLPHNSRGVCGLKSLFVTDCWDLVEIPGLDELIGLERLVLMHCRRFNRKSYWLDKNFSELQLPDLENFTKLKDLYLMGCRVEEAGFCIPRQLQKLFYGCDKSNKLPNLSGCDQLEVLHLDLHRYSGGLEALEDLPALRTLTLSGCRGSAGWPDLSTSRKLEVIMLYDKCETMLQEDDIHMLASLPVLQQVQSRDQDLELDVRRGKWKYAGYSEEWDFHIPIRSVIADCEKLFQEL